MQCWTGRGVTLSALLSYINKFIRKKLTLIPQNKCTGMKWIEESFNSFRAWTFVRIRPIYRNLRNLKLVRTDSENFLETTDSLQLRTFTGLLKDSYVVLSVIFIDYFMKFSIANMT